ncbi:MAG: chitobiase/beta-hexosaminidase C-terminal domain-containing protein [Spirochaetes bacterium]|nr:chitobiase/beta-hexosaminidase C-terminal domain-containing protein [Spirochaetota bacterium]
MVISCKGFSGVFTGNTPAAFTPGATVNLPKAGGGFINATVISLNGSTAAGLDLTGSGIPDILFIPVSGGNGRVMGLDVNGDGVIDYYLVVNFDGSITIETARTGGATVNLTTDANGNVTGFDTPSASGSPQNIFSLIKNDTTPPTIAASLAAGSYTGAQSVTLTCSDNVACNAIAYTTDGSTPSFGPPANGTLIAGNTATLTVSATTTLKYITRDAKGNLSTVGSEVYTFGCALVGGSTNCALTISGNVTTPYGNSAGVTAPGDTDATGNAARFYGPRGITSDGTNLFVVDSGNNKIRKIVIATGVVTTLAGPAAGCYNTCPTGDLDGTGTAARFNTPIGITYANGYLYVADSNNNKIRRIDTTSGVVSTIAGPAQGTTTVGDTDATANSARFNGPIGITTDGNSLYVADYTTYKIRKIQISTAVVTTLAGPAQGCSPSCPSGDTDGASTTARFSGLAGLRLNGSTLYVADAGNNKLRAIDTNTGAVSTPIGPTQGTTTANDTDGTGNAARFRAATDMVFDGTNIFIADKNNNKWRRGSISTFAITTFAGPAAGCFPSCPNGDADGSGTSALTYWPEFLCTDGTALYATSSQHKIRKIQ